MGWKAALVSLFVELDGYGDGEKFIRELADLCEKYAVDLGDGKIYCFKTS